MFCTQLNIKGLPNIKVQKYQIKNVVFLFETAVATSRVSYYVGIQKIGTIGGFYSDIG